MQLIWLFWSFVEPKITLFERKEFFSHIWIFCYFKLKLYQLFIFSSNISITINVWIIVVLHVWVLLTVLLMFSVLLLFGWFFLLINSFSSFVVFHEFPGVQWSLLVYFSDFFVVFIYLILSVPLLFHEFSFTNSRGPVVT